MTKKKTIETSQDLVQAVEELFDYVLMDVPQEAATVLREEGYDPERISETMARIAKEALAASPLNWRNKAEQLERESARLRETSRASGRSRAENEAYFRQLMDKLKYKPSSLAAAYRNLNTTTDSDLESLNNQIEFLLSQQDGLTDQNEAEG